MQSADCTSPSRLNPIKQIAPMESFGLWSFGRSLSRISDPGMSGYRFLSWSLGAAFGRNHRNFTTEIADEYGRNRAVTVQSAAKIRVFCSPRLCVSSPLKNGGQTNL